MMVVMQQLPEFDSELSVPIPAEEGDLEDLALLAREQAVLHGRADHDADKEHLRGGEGGGWEPCEG